MWEQCCIPSLLNGSGTRVEIEDCTIKQLNNLQYNYLLRSLQMGPGTPKYALLWDTGIMNMKLRIWKSKLMLALHFVRLEPLALAVFLITYWKEETP